MNEANIDNQTPIRLGLCVCTFHRNDELTRLLEAVLRNVALLPAGVQFGAIVVDDTAERLAEPVISAFSDRFALGITYLVSGTGNISVARNIGLEAAVGSFDWIVMTDDDCEPDDDWIVNLWGLQRATDAPSVTGPLRCVPPAGSPKWLTAQPFLESEYPAHGEFAPIGATHNSLLSMAWLRQHPEVRFQKDLGVIGGEDAVFYRQARAAGLTIRFASDAAVVEHTPIERTSYGYQLRRFLWHGNSSYVTAIQGGLSTPNRMLLAGLNRVRKALGRPFVRLFRHQPPQWRFALANLLHPIGTVLGRFGVRITHH